MKLYNTLSRRKEDFAPAEGPCRIYSCGPTVYNYAHIGNLRTYLFMDWLRRGLKANGFALRHVMNITDVGHLVSDADEGEDKLDKTARETGETPWEVAARVTEVFFRDIDALGVERPEVIAKATDHIPEMLLMVEGLCDKGYGYEISDGIYFDIQKFPGYGKLSRVNMDDLRAGARVEVNEEKRHPSDFALWKKAPPEHIMQWPSRWGQGYPGWHIECSAMARKYLGDTFDIHTGGIDHLPIHHENEIAQSECFTGKEPARFWLHAEFMMVDGGKMSKSLGNVYRIDDLRARGFAPMHLRYLCSQAHYRNKCNFTWEGMKSAKTAYERLVSALAQHRDAAGPADEALLASARARFFDAVSDDLNIPKGLGVLWEILRLPEKSAQIYHLALEFDKVLGLSLDSQDVGAPEAPPISADAERLLAKRQEARAAKDFARADKLRDEIKALGYAVKDTKDGATLEKLAAAD